MVTLKSELMLNDKKFNIAYFDCMRELYLHATPSADFDQLLKDAPLNEDGQKVIDYNSHTISEPEFEFIVKDVMKRHKIKKPLDVVRFRNSVLLGCSPKFS